MKLHIRPAMMRGQLKAPPSKSYFLRALALSLLAKGETQIDNIGHSSDEKIGIALLHDMGADVSLSEDSLRIRSNGPNPRKYTLFCGESSLALHLFSCISALLSVPIQLQTSSDLFSTTSPSFSHIFSELGVSYESRDGGPPFFIQGPLRATNIIVDGSLGTDFISALLIAYAATDAERITIQVNQPKSKPYLALTLELLAQFGYHLKQKKYQSFHFEYRSSLQGTSLRVPGDWQISAYLLVAAVLSGSLVLSGLTTSYTQAEQAILSVLEQSQSRIFSKHALENDDLTIEILPTSAIESFQCDLEHSPELFPPLAALAAFAAGTSYLSGLHSLTQQVAHRPALIIDTLSKLGVLCEKKGDTLCIQGTKYIQGGNKHPLDTEDHCVIMMAALLALRSKEGLYIEKTEVVKKHFPHFFTSLRQVGISVVEVPQQSSIKA